MQVLIVEDDVRLAAAIERILEENGYVVDTVHDGQSGVDWGETGIYDVIILDVMLPKMDGFTVASSLRRKNISTPILLLTARDAVPDKITGLDSGADDYMTKPFSPAEPPRRGGVRNARRVRPFAQRRKLRPFLRREVHTLELQGVLTRANPYGEPWPSHIERADHRQSLGSRIDR